MQSRSLYKHFSNLFKPYLWNNLSKPIHTLYKMIWFGSCLIIMIIHDVTTRAQCWGRALFILNVAEIFQVISDWYIFNTAICYMTCNLQMFAKSSELLERHDNLVDLTNKTFVKVQCVIILSWSIIFIWPKQYFIHISCSSFSINIVLYFNHH